MRIHYLLPLSIAACLWAGPAFAISFSPQVDFRDPSIWGGADHATSFSATQNGVDITLYAQPTPAGLYWDSTDGVGIRHNYEKDEIEEDERLKVLFGGETQLSAIYVSDLFFEDGYLEQGYYQILNGSWLAWEMFDATLPGTQQNGEHVIAFNPAVVVTGLKFKAPGKMNGQNHEFSLLGLDVTAVLTRSFPPTPVPEPSASLLFSAGGLFVVAALRRRRA